MGNVASTPGRLFPSEVRVPPAGRGLFTHGQIDPGPHGEKRGAGCQDFEGIALRGASPPRGDKPPQIPAARSDRGSAPGFSRHRAPPAASKEEPAHPRSGECGPLPLRRSIPSQQTLIIERSRTRLVERAVPLSRIAFRRRSRPPLRGPLPPPFEGSIGRPFEAVRWKGRRRSPFRPAPGPPTPGRAPHGVSQSAAPRARGSASSLRRPPGSPAVALRSSPREGTVKTSRSACPGSSSHPAREAARASVPGCGDLERAGRFAAGSRGAPWPRRARELWRDERPASRPAPARRSPFAHCRRTPPARRRAEAAPPSGGGPLSLKVIARPISTCRVPRPGDKVVPGSGSLPIARTAAVGCGSDGPEGPPRKGLSHLELPISETYFCPSARLSLASCGIPRALAGARECRACGRAPVSEVPRRFPHPSRVPCTQSEWR